MSYPSFQVSSRARPVPSVAHGVTGQARSHGYLFRSRSDEGSDVVGALGGTQDRLPTGRAVSDVTRETGVGRARGRGVGTGAGRNRILGVSAGRGTDLDCPDVLAVRVFSTPTEGPNRNWKPTAAPHYAGVGTELIVNLR